MLKMPVEELIAELDSIPTYGYSNKKKAAIAQTRDILSNLLNFVRTPEWSVSMLEDIAALVPTYQLDMDPDAHKAWRSH